MPFILEQELDTIKEEIVQKPIHLYLMAQLD